MKQTSHRSHHRGALQRILTFFAAALFVLNACSMFEDAVVMPGLPISCLVDSLDSAQVCD